jgi:hypothetical protein
MVRLEVRITTTDVIVTVPAGATTGTVSVPTTADTIDEVDESIANGTVSATGTIIDNNNAPTVATITPASAEEDLMWYSTLQQQPFCSRYFVYFCSGTNGTAGSADYDYG